MSSRPSRTAILIVAACLASCSENVQRSDAGKSEASRDASLPPDIAPTAAPGVAFKYNYEFRLGDRRIGPAQEAHAAACERLGLSRCRITGMSYSVDEDEQVSAHLDLKVDPSIARQFGKAAQQTVVANEGNLVRLDIGSSDEGQAIAGANQQAKQSSAQLARLEQELAKAKPGTDAHANLLSQIQALQRQLAEQSQAVSAGEAALASTPMTFHYYGEGGVPGFRGNPMRNAWHTFVSTVVTLVGFLLQALAVLLPVLLILALFTALWRTRPVRAVRRWMWGNGTAASDEQKACSEI